MARSIDFVCACGYREWAVADVDETRACPQCAAPMTQDWLPRMRRDAQWSDRDAVVVHINNDPNCPDDVRLRYPARNDAPPKPGYERVTLRSLREVERFERQHNVRSEMAWFDKGSGRGHDDYVTKKQAYLRDDGSVGIRTYEEKVSY